MKKSRMHSLILAKDDIKEFGGSRSMLDEELNDHFDILGETLRVQRGE